MSLTVWVSVAILLAANALYVSAEFGAVGVRRSRVRRLSEDGNMLARRLQPFVESPGALVRYLSASQIGITLSGLMLGAYGQATMSAALAQVLTSRTQLDEGTALSTAAVVVLLGLSGAQVLFGELVPKSIALQYPTESALATVLPMQWSLWVFRPFTPVLNAIAALILRLLGTRAGAHRHVHSPEEIELFIAESRDGGLLEPEEQQRLHRALRLGLRSARDLMVPLDRLTVIAVDTPWDDVVRTVAASPFSRLPVFRESRENIIGMLRVKDLVERYVADGPTPLSRLLRPVVKLGQDLPADRVIGVLRERRVHSAVVTDAESRVIGLITIQDVLSELLGSAGGATAKSRP